MACGDVFTVTNKFGITLVTFFCHAAKLKNNQTNDKILIKKFYL